jgi:hypothetical protein
LAVTPQEKLVQVYEALHLERKYYVATAITGALGFYLTSPALRDEQQAPKALLPSLQNEESAYGDAVASFIFLWHGRRR